jgi:predicted tellurium resistance membrane protein TerC
MLEQILPTLGNLGLETPAILIVLIALEAVLSADNAIALAAIAKGLPMKQNAIEL